MAQTRRIDELSSAAGEEPSQSVMGTPQRDRFRDSLRDAFDGFDVEDLQGGPSAAVAGVPAPPPGVDAEAPPLPPPITPAPAWNPTRAMVELPAGAPPTALDALPAQIRMEVESAIAPLQAEVARMRAEMARLESLPGEMSRVRRGDMIALAGLLVVAFAAAAVVVAAILRS
jgi:hypothetical protein